MEVARFEEKLNKVDGNVYVIEENVQLTEGVYNGELKHDNINPASLAIYTGPRLTGERIQSYSISTPSLTPWKRVIKVFADASEVYISYETDGDTVEAEDINRLQEAVTKTQTAVNSEFERALRAEEGLEGLLSEETQRAKDTEAELGARIDEESGRAQTAERTLKSELTSESERATNAEHVLAQGLSEEMVRAQAAERILTENLSSETTRAEAAEEMLADDITDEVRRAGATEKTLTDSLAAEVARAKAAERVNADGLSAEIIRAEGEEKNLTNNLTSEVTRAKAAEKVNSNAIAAEKTRAAAAEQGIEGELTTHKANASNPHKVTKAQVGLGNVTNESKAVMFTSPVFTGTPIAPSASAEANTNQVATTKFVQEAIGRGIAASDAMIFKGTLGNGGTLTSLPSSYLTGWTYRVITAGTYAGQRCEPGDLVVALLNRDGSGSLDTDWAVAQTNIDGAVVSTRKIFAGNGLNGGGDLAADRTFHVGAGNGIAVAADTVAVKPNATGTAGTVGKSVVDANGVGVVLGTESTTAFRGDQGKTAYAHSQAAHARTDATKTEVSATNGNIRINGTDIRVYTHPSGTNPHGTTKADVGLGNVPNVITNDQSITYTAPTTLSALSSGEKLSVAMGKLAKTVADLMVHLGDTVKHVTVDERTKWNSVTSKVDKISGKQLSTNDYTTAEKSKLAGMVTGAEVNVQSDWKVTDATSDAYIKNKPASLPASDVSAWAKTASKPSYGWTEITGKPSTFTPSVHTHIKAQIADMPTKLSQFTNDTGYLKTSDIDTSQNHTHANKTVLDKITQVLMDKWNSALTALPAHTHTKSQISDFPTSMPASGGNAATVAGHSVNADVPANAKFTDTVYTHPNSAAAGGTYRSVTVNAQGHVTAGSNPTTLSGYGITDAAAKNHNHDNKYMPKGPFSWAQMSGAYTWNQLKGV